MTNRFGQVTGEFREQLVLRAIYEVGHNPTILSNYVGMRRDYVMSVCLKHRKVAMKAAREFLAGRAYGLSVMDSFRGIGRAIQDKFARRRSLSFMKKKFGAHVRKAVVGN